MKLIIDIPETILDWIKQEWVDNPEYINILDEIMKSILRGKPYEERPQGDLISREALRNVILNDRKLDGANANWEVNRILVHIDNAPTVEQRDNFDFGYIQGLEDGRKERPQGNIRWTDKVFVTSSGDIIDFEGMVVGHINLEEMKGGAE